MNIAQRQAQITQLQTQFEGLLQEWHHQKGLILGVNAMWFRDLAEFLLHSQLVGTLLLKAHYADRAPFCPDHRDKVIGKPCRECLVEHFAYYVSHAIEMNYFDYATGKKLVLEAAGKIPSPTPGDK